MRKIFPAILFFLCCCAVSAQVYPVQLSAQLSPPYSGYLADYTDPSSEKLRIIIQLNDFSQSQVTVKLRLEIKGNGFTIISKQLFNGAPITLFPGQPAMISGAELAPYLNSNNLDFIGINKSQYEQKKVLPEGYYSICVKAFDYYNPSPVQLSNEACAQAWFTQSNPPILNLPQCNITLSPQYPQNILFQWTPMHLGSPNSSFNTEYEFALWECLPDTNVNPNQIVLSAAPVFSTTTQQNFYNYGISDGPLNLYTKYVWRVRAKDVSGRDLFKNNGRSEICVFRYGSLSQVLGNSLNITLTAGGTGHRTGLCSWTKQSAFTSYLLQVRKKGTTQWFDYPNTIGSERISNLEPNTSYECRVRGEAPGMTGNWSNSAVFTTGPPSVYSCNNQNVPPLINNNLPLAAAKAKPGMIFQSGQFEVFTTQIQATFQPGWFSGRGYVIVLGRRVNVFWSSIYIDQEQVHQSGVIEAVTKGIDKWLSQWDIKQAEENATYVDSQIDSVYTNGSQICYVVNGNPFCVTPPPNQNVMVIRDGEGNQYTIDLVPPPPKINGPASYLNSSADTLSATDNFKIVFEEFPAQNFGFDKKQHAAFIKDYEVIKMKDGKNYFVANKSIGADGNDAVYAQLVYPSGEASKLSFKTRNGTVRVATTTTIASVFKVSGLSADDAVLYAYYDGKRIGKLNILKLEAKTKKLVLIPVNGANCSHTAANLNQIFKQANINFSLTIKPSFTFNLGNDGLEAADAKLMSKYSAEMRALRDAYKQHDSAYDKGAYHIFIVPNFNNPEIKGYMVRGKSLGFISADAATKDLAHELAHGCFSLEHTFPQIAKGSSDNLMDYNSGTALVNSQWQLLQYVKPVFSWLDDEEDAEFKIFRGTGREAFYLLNKIRIANKENKNFDLGLDPNLHGRMESQCFIGGMQFDSIGVYTYFGYNHNTTPVKGLINIISRTVISATAIVTQSVISINDGKIIVTCPPNRLTNMKAYLESTATFKNLLLFVNGYRPIVNFNGDGQISLVEYNDSENIIEFGDSRGYWQGIDAQFMNRIGTRNVAYADGHHMVATSNHLSVSRYLQGHVSSMASKAACLNNINPLSCQFQEFLHKIPNQQGFTYRAANGMKAAENLISQITLGNLLFNKNSDTLDIVAHSMGYAYAVGMITKLKEYGVKFGRFYIIAPENAVSGGCNWNDFQEVWQYGTNENTCPPYYQDGVAPQGKVYGLPFQKSRFGRVYIPDDFSLKVIWKAIV